MRKHFHVGTGSIMAGLLAGLASTLAAAAANLHVPDDHPTIQAAVDAGNSGDTIMIAPGVYVEQIAITNKNLTLAGVPGTVIRASDGLVPTTPHHCTVFVLGIVQADVVVKGLTFEGEHLSDTYDCSYGAIIFDGASGQVEDCTVRGFRPNILSGFNGIGVAADNYDPSPRNVQVLRCTFADNGVSLHVRGSDGANDPVRLTFTVADNRINGIGPTTLGSQIGILISAGASGEVLRNVISDHAFNGTTNTSYGVFAVDWRFQFGFGPTSPIALKPVRYVGNTFQNNQLHLASVLAHGSQFVTNTFQGAGLGPVAGGLALTGNTNLIVGNRFSDLTRGITLVGDDPDFHTVYGIAQNPTLIGNQFCQVTTPLVTQPLVTGVTEQGTLVCPFPTPSLTIAPAVLLTWPAVETGYVVERATNPAGPWTSLSITPSVAGNEATVTVTTTDAAKFFRLQQSP